MDRLAQGLQGSFHFTLVLEHQGNTQGHLQPLVASPLVLGYQDSILQELQGSSPPVLEPLGSFPGSIHLKELRGSFLEARPPSQLDRFPLARELLLGRTLMCLSQEVNQEETMGCTDQVVQVRSLLQPAPAHFLHFPPEVFHRYLPGHGDHLQVEASLQPQGNLVQDQGPWVRTVGLPLQEACW